MIREQPKGPICQSCGMPMATPEEFGTAKGGVRSEEYCRYCFVNGRFTDPKMSMGGMIEFCVRILTQRRLMPEPEARSLMNTVIPTLKRWRTPATAGV